MSADLEKLLPCPFCGGDNVGVFGPVGWYRTYGISHSCRMFYSGTSEMAQGFPDKKTAIAAWNARAPDLARQVIALTADNAALRMRVAETSEAEARGMEMAIKTYRIGSGVDNGNYPMWAYDADYEASVRKKAEVHRKAASDRADQNVTQMTDLPAEIKVWRSTDALDHIGTWATKRYPAEAVTYVPQSTLTADNAALRAKAEKLAGELDSMCCALHAEGDAHLVTKAKTARLMEAATPFSEMAGEMFARNWNKDSVAISFVTPDGPIRLTFEHFLALRQATTEWREIR